MPSLALTLRSTAEPARRCRKPAALCLGILRRAPSRSPQRRASTQQCSCVCKSMCALSMLRNHTPPAHPRLSWKTHGGRRAAPRGSQAHAQHRRKPNAGRVPAASMRLLSQPVPRARAPSLAPVLPGCVHVLRRTCPKRASLCLGRSCPATTLLVNLRQPIPGACGRSWRVGHGQHCGSARVWRGHGLATGGPGGERARERAGHHRAPKLPAHAARAARVPAARAVAEPATRRAAPCGGAPGVRSRPLQL
jgi:hypothetical protein